jgi:hypothetical protein
MNKKYTITISSVYRGQLDKEFDTIEQAQDYINTYDRKYVRILATNF